MSAPAANALSLPVMTIARDRVVGVEPLERVLELHGERVVQRVHALRPVETDETDAIARLDDDVLVSHATLLKLRPARGNGAGACLRSARYAGFAFQLST